MNRSSRRLGVVMVALSVAVTSLWGATPPARAALPTALWYRSTVDPYGFFEVEGLSGFQRWDNSAGWVLRIDRNSLLLRDNLGNPTASEIKSDVALHLFGSLNPLDWLQVGVELPISFARTSGNFGARTFDPNGIALGDLMLQGKFLLLSEERAPLSVGAVLALTFPTGQNSKLYGAGTVEADPSIVLSKRHPMGPGYLFWSTELGVRIRGEGKLIGLDTGHEFHLGAGLGYHFDKPRLDLMAEWVLRTQLKQFLSDKASTPSEVRMGLRWLPHRYVAVTAALGTGVVEGYGATDYRILLGAAWAQHKEPEPEVVPPGDRDGDGILDDVDQCPDDPEDRDGFQDADGCPDVDNDGDGILDVDDGCPNEPEDRDGYQDEDGCPDLDNDGDGILDDADRCPSEPETVNDYQDEDGCPDERPKQGGDRFVIQTDVLFDYNKSDVKPEGERKLLELVEDVKRHPEIRRLSVEGHTDYKGTDSYNMALSKRRAESVVRFLVSHGLPREMLEARWFGKSRPVDPARTDEARARNRRVELEVLEVSPAAP
ncbi:MAG: OmpA family protein [Deltaproteobacteria bacterium]|nr:OmpA family protein [Deltaproteobacteria bacterium]